ncbi:hypothetical protein BD410DRAFT_794677 [Rickenella mellea]|uniref:Uncharacterized protein n=1 Tax=Rickenella mellea TaxID=50990 RepID=A0A4Y7PQG0_9AGAM|nr:hypothetical protein BD410DRAFT_794677 [Rickenella mellea]
MNNEQSTATHESVVTVNYLFFDRLRPNNVTRYIKLPRPLFNEPSQDCQAVFATELQNTFSFQADEKSIKFWKPKEELLADTVYDSVDGWTEAIDEAEFRRLFKPIPLIRPLASALQGETDNKEAVHLIITGKGSDKVGAVEDDAEKTAKRPLSGAGSDTQDSKRARSSIETDPTPPWLIELHQALWNKPELRDSIYFEKEITFSDFLALEESLNLIPSRDEPPKGGLDVGDIKLAKLHSIPQAVHIQESHGDGGKDEDNKGGDNGDGGDGEDDGGDDQDDEGDDRDNVEGDDQDDQEDDQDDEGDIHDNEDDGQDDEDDGQDDKEEAHPVHGDITSLFPVRVRYINLSSLKLKSATNRCPSPIFIRDEYTLISRVLSDGPPGKAGSAIVTGQPGIGKTTYLYERLIDRLLDGEPTYFQTEDGRLFFISEEVTLVDARTLHKAGDNVVALVDADLSTARPQPVLLTSTDIQTIVTSSPKSKEDQKWLDQVGGGRRGMIYAMDLWSYQEFMVAGAFFFPWDIDPNHRLKLAIMQFGLTPRQTWHASISKTTLKAAEAEVRRAVAAMVPTNSLEILLEGATNGDSSLMVSHTIFQIAPKDNDRLFHEVYVQAKSKWIFDVVLKLYEKRQSDAARQFYELTKHSTTTASLAGIIWEREVHRYFRSIKTREKLHLVSLQDGKRYHWQYPGGAMMVKFRIPGLTEVLQTAVEKQEARYCQPLALNFEAVDALVYQPGKLSCIQITDATTHPIKVNGLQSIQRCLPPTNAALASLRPLHNGNKKSWPFIFVVPKDSKFSRVPQKLIGGTDIWHRKVHQFLLLLPDTKVWPRHASS